MSHKSHKVNYEEFIININKKRENLYNTYSSYQELIDYHDTVIVYNNLNEPVIHKEKKKALDIDKHLFTNTKKYTIHIHKPTLITIDKDLIGCLTTIDYYNQTHHEQTILEKVTIKGVNMDVLIDDLNKNGIHVTKLLTEIEKHQFNLDQIYDYLNKNNIDIPKIMIILNNNQVTMTKLLQNSYIRNMIKQSSYSWFCDDKNSNVDKKITSKKLIKKITCYAIYKLKPDPVIISINWNNIKI